VTASERITIIQEAASRLAEGSLVDCDLVLKQLRLPTGRISAYGNDLYRYAVGQIEEGSDEQLSELHTHLFLGDGPAATEPDGSRTWAAGAFRLFISHTHDHCERAGKLRDHLRAWDVDGFVAHEDIKPTDEWENEIQIALGTCYALCALMTPDFVQSKWCDQEIGFAVARRILVVPLKLGADPHGFIGKYQAITVPHGATPASVATLVFDALATNPLTANKMAPAIVHRYANSKSFNGTEQAFVLLESIPTSAWTEAMIEQAERAASENTQVKNACLPDGRKAPAAVEAILKDVRGDSPPLVSPSDDDIPF
jgi:hypothetical protein